MPFTGFAIKITDAPLQIIPSSFAAPEDSEKAMAGAGRELTVTVAEAGATQLLVVLVTLTV
jgi:hypothetical protein